MAAVTLLLSASNERSSQPTLVANMIFSDDFFQKLSSATEALRKLESSCDDVADEVPTEGKDGELVRYVQNEISKAQNTLDILLEKINYLK